MHAWRKMLFCMAAILFIGPAANSRDLIVDLSDPVVQIRTDFAGKDLLLFGAKRNAGDVVVVVRGPKTNQVVRKKGRVAGIWVNREEMTFDGHSAYYAVVANRPLDEILSPELRAEHQLGFNQLRIVPATKDAAASAEDIRNFRAALLRHKQREGLYIEREDLTFVSDMLFRTDIAFPATVPTGAFTVESFLINNGEITAVHNTTLEVGKFGIEAEVFRFAYEYSLLYGIFAVLIACFAGWLANAAFRKA